MSPRFTIVVPVRNQRESLELLLQCLEQQTVNARHFECIIVDDGSADDTTAALDRPWNVDVRLAMTGTPCGIGEAKNLGAESGRGEFIIFLDGDVLPCPRWLEGFDQELSRGRCEAVSGARFNLPINPRDRALRALVADAAGVPATDLLKGNPDAQFARIHTRAARGHYPTRLCEQLDAALEPLYRQDPRHQLCAYGFVGCNAGVSRALFQKVGGFDSLVRRNQDIELALRLWEAGCRFGHSADARGYHLYHCLDRQLGTDERYAFFWRHPYRIVVAMYVWMLAQAGGWPARLEPPLDSVPHLATGLRSGHADLDGQLRPLYRQLLDPEWCVSEREVTTYLAEARGITLERASRALRRALRCGLTCLDEEHGRRTQAIRRFDLHLTSNWMDRCRGRRLTLRPAQRLLECGARSATGVESSMRCTGTYAVEFRWEDLASEGPLVLHVPLPCAESSGADLRFVHCTPPDLLRFRRGHVVSYPIAKPSSGLSLVSYAFELSRGAGGDYDTANDSRTALLEPTYAPKFASKLQELLQRILPEDVPDPIERERRIETWVRERVGEAENRFSDTWILESGLGDTVQITRLFVNLCRLARIPARERCGALLTAGASHSSCEWIARGIGRSPLSTTWAEVLAGGNRWSPRVFTRPVSRRAACHDGVRTLIAAAQASQIAGFPQGPTLSAGRAFVHTRHTLVCRFSPRVNS